MDFTSHSRLNAFPHRFQGFPISHFFQVFEKFVPHTILKVFTVRRYFLSFPIYSPGM